MTRLTEYCFVAALALSTMIACQDAEPGLGAGDPDAGDALEGDLSFPDVPDGAGGDAVGPSVETDGLELIYTAHAGVSVPWLTPVDGGGARPMIRLAPERARGYGGGEGSVSYPEVTPDGRFLVVLYYPLAGGSQLFAVPLDGSGANAPVQVARGAEISALERAYSDHGWIAYVEQQTALYAAPLDGSLADSPVLLAQGDEGHRLEWPVWLDGGARVAFSSRPFSGNPPRTYTVAADGSEADSPRQIVTGPGAEARGGAALPDGRLLVAGHDDRLYAVEATGEDPIALTPAGRLASYQGSSPDGARIVVELRDTWQEARELISVATDGSEADDPVRLTAEPIAGLRATMSRDGTRVAWVGTDEAERWAVFESAIDQPRLPDPRITSWRETRLFVSSYDASADALVGGDALGNVLRYTLPGGHDRSPVTLDTVDSVVNYSGPYPQLSKDGRYVLYDARTSEGWLSRVVPLEGGEPIERQGAWYRDLVTPFGIVHHEYLQLGAAFALGLSQGSGAPRPLTGWHRSDLRSGYLASGGRWLVYAADWPAPGWYAVPTDGRRDAPLERPTMPVESWEPDGWPAPIRPPAVMDGRLLRQREGRVEAFRLDGSDGQTPRVLLTDVSRDAIFDSPRDRIIAAQSGALVSLELEGGGEREPVVVLRAASVSQMLLHPNGEQILVLGRLAPEAEQSLVIARLDGSQAEAPQVLVEPLLGWAIGLAFSPTGEHVFSVHSIEATAVPHPDQLMTSSTVAGASMSRELAPRGYFFWEMAPWFDNGLGYNVSALVATADGQHVFLTGPDGLYSARSDGSDGAAPVWLGTTRGSLGRPLEPNGGHRVLSADGAGIFLAEAGRAESQRLVTAAPEGEVVAETRWSVDGGQVIFRTQQADVWVAQGLLYQALVSGDAEPPTQLTPSDFPLESLVGLMPDGRGALVQSTVLGDRNLFWVGVGDDTDLGLDPTVVTSVDDAGERFVGLVERDE